ncbi:aminoglycoside phosphotransferase family protein [Sediminibacillus massiliensis]|uniref:aminoglycoside phosphotransferase family protein n=1 Tax=Sediminibacillus massiliensis TaxID=1926277 RepID=UPI000988471D|nr:aminoglycoside phosphotransferase family protein [Sediminibacillus massiliensis]
MQKQFEEAIRLYFPNEGEAWLRKIPDLLSYCEEKWELKMEKAYELSVNYVAPARMRDGRRVVVKVSIPGKEFENELEALQLLQSPKLVKVLDFDREAGVLILEELVPGTMLVDLEDDEHACFIAAGVLKGMLKKSPSHTGLPSTEDRENSMRQIMQEHPEGLGPFPIATLEKACQVFHYLNKTIETYWLLHGDYHHYNILLSGEDNWMVIDPKGLVGEIEYDLIQYLLNKLPEQDYYSIIQNRIDIFIDKLDLSRERLLMWGFCHTVLSTCWTVNDEKGTYEESFFKAVRVFEEMYRDEFGRDLWNPSNECES